MTSESMANFPTSRCLQSRFQVEPPRPYCLLAVQRSAPDPDSTAPRRVSHPDFRKRRGSDWKTYSWMRSGGPRGESHAKNEPAPSTGRYVLLPSTANVSSQVHRI